LACWNTSGSPPHAVRSRAHPRSRSRSKHLYGERSHVPQRTQPALRVAQPTSEAPLLVDLLVGQPTSTFRRETDQAISTSRPQNPINECGVVPPAVWRQMVEASGVVDQVVRPCHQLRIEDGAAAEVDGCVRRLCPIPRPSDRFCREVDSVDQVSVGRQEGGAVPDVSVRARSVIDPTSNRRPG
jgi:hypothetical protein